MKIKAIHTAVIHIPLRTPFKTALRSVGQVESVLVQIETGEGITGLGEAPPTAVITGDTTASIISAVKDYIAPVIIGREIEDIDGIMGAISGCILKNTSAKAAVDMAVYDLYGKSIKRPLYQVLGGAKKEIETDLTISVNPVDEMIRDSLDAVSRGFGILKIKVGKDSTKDIERLTNIWDAVNGKAKIRVDANQGWTAGEAVRIIGKLEDAGVVMDLVEQPVKAHDLQGMKYVTENTYTPVLADESVFSPKDAITILENHAADMINIKLMKTGGLYEALKICSIAECYGVSCMAGCMLESKIAVSAAAHLAAAKNVITAVDLDGPSLCSEDPYEGGPEFEGSRIIMPQESGIGIRQINRELVWE